MTLHADDPVHRLVDLVIAEKLSKVAWPAWNAVCLRVRSSSEVMKQRSLFRLPRIYQAAVRFLVASTILTDTVVLSSHAARLIRQSHDDIEWRAHAYMGATFDLLLNLLLTWVLTIFIDAVSDMQTPFGSEGLDMPGLSYVCASAELSLRMVHRGPNQRYRLFSVLNSPLDVQAMTTKVRPPSKGTGKAPTGAGVGEENDDDDDE